MPVFESFICVDKLGERCASPVLGLKSLMCMDFKGCQIISLPSMHRCVGQRCLCKALLCLKGDLLSAGRGCQGAALLCEENNQQNALINSSINLLISAFCWLFSSLLKNARSFVC
jgi:hypothetical protein